MKKIGSHARCGVGPGCGYPLHPPFKLEGRGRVVKRGRKPVGKTVLCIPRVMTRRVDEEKSILGTELVGVEIGPCMEGKRGVRVGENDCRKREQRSTVEARALKRLCKAARRAGWALERVPKVVLKVVVFCHLFTGTETYAGSRCTFRI
jgi:hypothetical protein